MGRLLLVAWLLAWRLPAAAAPLSPGDQVVRGRPLDLTQPVVDPVADFRAHFIDQESRRLRALKDLYPRPDPLDGHYNPQAMRDWQKSVLSQQVSAAAGAAGDAALDYCRVRGFCEGRAAEAAATLAGLLFNGLHWKVPFGPVVARLDTPPGVRMEMRRVKLSLSYYLAF